MIAWRTKNKQRLKEYEKDYRDRNPRVQKKKAIKRDHGITLEIFEKMILD